MNTPFPQHIVARSFAVIDPINREIAASHNIQERSPIASIQKLLTALLVVEQGGLDQLVEIRPEDIACMQVRAGLRVGEYYSRRTLLACMLIGSANDAALALARDHSGNISAFAGMMNQRATDLGMTASLFYVPHGLPHEGQYSSARDVIHLATAVDAVPLIRDLVKQRQFDFCHSDGMATTVHSTNKLLTMLSVCDGMKTGFTCASGYCLVASGSLGEKRRIAVVLGSQHDTVWHDAYSLLVWGLGLPESERCEQFSPVTHIG